MIRSQACPVAGRSRLETGQDAQVRRLIEEMNKNGHVEQAAMKAGMDRKTARRCVSAAKLPSR